MAPSTQSSPYNRENLGEQGLLPGYRLRSLADPAAQPGWRKPSRVDGNRSTGSSPCSGDRYGQSDRLLQARPGPGSGGNLSVDPGFRRNHDSRSILEILQTLCRKTAGVGAGSRKDEHGPYPWKSAVLRGHPGSACSGVELVRQASGLSLASGGQRKVRGLCGGRNRSGDRLPQNPGISQKPRAGSNRHGGGKPFVSGRGVQHRHLGRSGLAPGDKWKRPAVRNRSAFP